MNALATPTFFDHAAAALDTLATALLSPRHHHAAKPPAAVHDILLKPRGGGPQKPPTSDVPLTAAAHKALCVELLEVMSVLLEKLSSAEYAYC